MNRAHEPGRSTGVAGKTRGLVSGSSGKLFVSQVGLTHSKCEAKQTMLELKMDFELRIFKKKKLGEQRDPSKRKVAKAL